MHDCLTSLRLCRAPLIPCCAMAASSTAVALRRAVDRKDWTLAQTMIRITDPAKSIPFFEKLGFRLLECVRVARIPHHANSL